MKESLRERIRTELAALSQDGAALVAMLLDLEDPQKTKSFDHFVFADKYQKWYTRALRVVTTLAPDRRQDFVGYYEIDPKRKSVDIAAYRIQDFLKGFAPDVLPHTGKRPYDRDVVTKIAVFNQLTILRSVESRLDDVLSNLEGHIAAEIQDAGVAAGRDLLNISPRAAGSLAGVVLEDHLQRVAALRGVRIAKKDPTIGDLNDPLRAADVYDQPTWRKIQFLGDIRNLCSHKKASEPSEEQVQELIDGTSWVIANVH